MAKKLSPAMFAWAKANKSKLKNPTAAQKKIFAAYAAMVKAGDKPANPKPRPTSKPAPKASAPKPKQTSKAEAESRFYSSSSGTRGQLRPSNPPGPNVTKPYGQLDRSGARVRRNQQDARRSQNSRNADVRAASGSNRRNNAAIKAEVDRNYRRFRESQRAKERRQRLARERAARRNRTNLIARRNNDM